MNSKTISLVVGLGIVILTHLWMLCYGMEDWEIVPHSLANLTAAGLIIYAFC